MRKNKDIGSSLEAEVTITASGKDYEALASLGKNGAVDYLCELFIVSAVKLEKGEGPVSISAAKATGEKCMRCWNYSPTLSTIGELPDLCPKCVEATT